MTWLRLSSAKLFITETRFSQTPRSTKSTSTNAMSAKTETSEGSQCASVPASADPDSGKQPSTLEACPPTTRVRFSPTQNRQCSHTIPRSDWEPSLCGQFKWQRWISWSDFHNHTTTPHQPRLCCCDILNRTLRAILARYTVEDPPKQSTHHFQPDETMSTSSGRSTISKRCTCTAVVLSWILLSLYGRRSDASPFMFLVRNRISSCVCGNIPSIRLCSCSRSVCLLRCLLNSAS